MADFHDPFPPPSKKPLLRSLTFQSTSHRRHRPFFKPSSSDTPDAQVIIYTTSLRGIRRTYADCCAVRAILRGFRVAMDERDVSMDSGYRRELQVLLKGRPAALPQAFVGGRHVGGADEVRQLHESGELGRLLDGVPRQDPGFVCGGCGGARFVPCGNCCGSRRVFVEEEGRRRRCEVCNENGLVRCPNCCSSFH